MTDFLRYCVLKYGAGINPFTCRDVAFLQAVLRTSVECALRSGNLNAEGQLLAHEYLINSVARPHEHLDSVARRRLGIG
jgi:hypothetical protein